MKIIYHNEKTTILIAIFPLIILSQTSEEVPTLHQEINGIKIGVPNAIYFDELPIFKILEFLIIQRVNPALFGKQYWL